MAAVGHLVSAVAHEVNNPLTAILGFTDLLMENPEIPESARATAGDFAGSAAHKQIVQNLLSFARKCRRSETDPTQFHFAAHRAPAFVRFHQSRHSGDRTSRRVAAPGGGRFTPATAGVSQHSE